MSHRIPAGRGCRATLALAAVVAWSSHAHATVTTVDTAIMNYANDIRNYSVIGLGNSTFTGGSNAASGIAVDGNLSLGGGTIASSSSGITSDPTLYVTGSVTVSGQTHLSNGYASLPGAGSGWTWTASQKQLSNSSGSISSANSSASYAADNPINNPGPSGWNASTLATSLTSISSTLASATVNGSITVACQDLVFSGPANPTGGVVIFTLDMNDFSGNSYNGQNVSGVLINVPAGINYVINVVNAAGTTILGSGINFNTTNGDQILWNIEGSGTVTWGANTFVGSVLAPSATVDVTSGSLDGQMVAASFDANGADFNYDPFAVGSVVVPESAEFAWGAVGLCMLGIAARRRRPR